MTLDTLHSLLCKNDLLKTTYVANSRSFNWFVWELEFMLLYSWVHMQQSRNKENQD